MVTLPDSQSDLADWFLLFVRGVHGSEDGNDSAGAEQQHTTAPGLHRSNAQRGSGPTPKPDTLPPVPPPSTPEPPEDVAFANLHPPSRAWSYGPNWIADASNGQQLLNMYPVGDTGWYWRLEALPSRRVVYLTFDERHYDSAPDLRKSHPPPTVYSWGLGWKGSATVRIPNYALWSDAPFP
uniref:HP5 n=1 Tax=Agave tequilana deltaflexivirus 1 TaxID=2794415 RepID=A0A7T5UFC0_9VIRU|nr:HP5 [Agave tequilana deltaflexivirus 1]